GHWDSGYFSRPCLWSRVGKTLIPRPPGRIEESDGWTSSSSAWVNDDKHRRPHARRSPLHCVRWDLSIHSCFSSPRAISLYTSWVGRSRAFLSILLRQCRIASLSRSTHPFMRKYC